ncbi:MAG: hypothetical protein ACXU82_13170 [Caulobacteraceae bacterium]
MVGRGAALVLCAALAAAFPAQAEDDQATAVSGVGVSLPKTCLGPREPPDLKVPVPTLLSTYPARDQVVRPGLMILRLTFDLPMACWPQGGPTHLEAGRPDPCATTPRVQHWVLLKERLDWTVLCRLEPKTRYSFRVKSFKGLSGRETEPFTLTFYTSDEPPVLAVKDALALAGRPRRPEAEAPPEYQPPDR